jgi:hypothetical protein
VKISAKHRKFIIMGFGIIAILVLAYILFSGQTESDDFTVAVENKKRMLSKYLETLELEGPYEVALQQYRSRLQQDRGRLLVGDNPNVAESELLKVLTDIANKNNVEITQKIVQKEEKIQDMLYKVSTRIVTQCETDQLIQFLIDIKNYNKFLTIDEFTVQTRSSRTRPSTEIRPSLTISGYISLPETGINEEEPGANT